MSTMARVVTTCRSAPSYGTVREKLAILDRALMQKPDIVCLPEGFATTNTSSPSGRNKIDKFPGPTANAVAKRAKRHRCYIICPVNAKRDGKIRNSAIVFDRTGNILGIYDKIHPVTTTHDYTVFEDGTTPGNALAVFDLDFGRVGIQICFDAGFPETWTALAKKGVNLVFWPSAYTGGFPLQAYACIHHYYIVSSVCTDKSRIINPCGRIVAETDSIVNVAAYDLNLDFAVCHHDFNYGVPDRVVDAYGERVRVTSYTEDAHFLIEPTDPNVSIKQLQQEFGFEPAKAYYDRHRKGYRRILSGQKPLRQKAGHGKRPQYTK